MVEKVQFIAVTQDDASQRVDNYLFRVCKGVPKTRIYKALRKGEVRVNKGRIAPAYKLKVDDVIRIPPLRMASTQEKNQALLRLLAQKIEAAIIYEDADMIVVDKPCGIPVHAGSGNDAGVIEAMRYSRADNAALALGHRLDRYTSGCLVLLKNRRALRAFHHILGEDATEKKYRCIVRGRWPEPVTDCEKPLLMRPGDDGVRKAFVDSAGKYARSIFTVQQYCNGISYLEVVLKTGRTHQIRAHAAALGHPILGDSLYATPDKRYKRLYLHAYQLGFVWQDEVRARIFTAAIPKEFMTCLNH